MIRPRTKAILHDIGNKLSEMLGVIVSLEEGSVKTRLSAKIEATVHMLHDLVHSMKDDNQRAPPILDLDAFLPMLQKHMVFLKNAHGFSVCEVTTTHSGKIIAQVSDVFVIVEELARNAKRAGASSFCLSIHDGGMAVRFSFQDNGRGMTQTEINNLGFGWSTSGGGSGIALIRRMVADMEGAVNWMSLPGSGTFVEILFRKSENCETTFESKGGADGGTI